MPKVRKHLSGDALFGSLRTVFADIADHRQGDSASPLSDALMSACAMFALKSPSLLAFDKERTEDNVQRVYGIGRVPCDTSRREILDPVEPASLRPACKAVFRQLQRGKALEAMVFVEGHYLLALDGTGSFASKAMHGDSCLEYHHRNGTGTSSQQMWGAARIHPDKRAVIPLMPAPILPQDGATKNDCARNAAQRFIAKLRQDHPHLKLLVTEDSLRSNAPHIETLQEPDRHSIVGGKEGDQAFLFKHVVQAEQAGRVTSYEREARKAGVHHRFRVVCGLPLNESNAKRRVHCIAGWETVGGTVQHCSWVTALCVNKGTV